MFKIRKTLIVTLLSIIFTNVGFAQSVKVTLSLKNSTLKELVSSVEKQTNYTFVFYNEINSDLPVSVTSNNEALKSVLDKVLPPLEISFEVSGNHLILKKAMERTLKKVSGFVKDDSGEGIIGANVVEKGTTNGTVTDMNGYFEFSVAADAVLQVTYIGYNPKEVSASSRQPVAIQLEEDSKQIEEIVVIGYGTQKKISVTGSVVSLKGDEVMKSPSINVANSLIGRLPGVIINNRSGEPGRDDPSIFIRGKSTTGDSSPLVLIDGVERGGLGEINPNDIENISVLKDASAAIYGARAANGVLLVTTKRGNTMKPSVSFSYNQGFSESTRTPKMADSYTYAKVYNEIEEGEGRAPRYTAEELEKYRNGSDPDYPNTDWYGFITKKLTPQHRVNLSVSGGNERLKYYLSLGESHQSGHYKNGTTDVRLYNLRSNIDVQVTKYLQVGMNLAGKVDDNHYPYFSTNETYSHIFLYLPSWQPYWPGTDKLMPNRGSENIMNMVSDAGGTRDIKTTALQSTVSFKLDIPWVKGLWLDGSASYDAGYVFTKDFQTPDYVYYKDEKTGELYKGRSGMGSDKANLSEKYENPTNLYMTAKLNYDHTFGVHHVGAMVGYEQSETKGNYLQAYRGDYVSISIPEIFAGSSDKNKQSNDGSSSQTARQNIFGRLSYDYAGKYLAQFTFRRDGSPNFPENKRYGFFPGFSLGWRISEEPFMKNLLFLDNLKIRGSYGKMGNDQVGAYQYLTTYSYGNNYVIGKNDVTGLVQNGVPNPNITWEVAKTTNIGFDSRLWNGLLGIEFDYFKTRRSNILTKRSAIIPDYTGLKLPDENIGIVDNKGFEMIVSHENYSNPLKYRLSANVSFARNKVVFSDEQPAAEPYQYATGRPIGSGLYYNAIGIFESEEQIESLPHLLNTQPGDIIYEDVNKDGQIDSRDRIRVNQTNTPEIVYSFNANFEYKGFDLSLLFQGQENAKQYFGSYFPVMSYSLGNFMEWRAKDRWTPESTKASMPRGSSSMWNNNTEASTQWLLNAGFLRLKNLEFGYTLPASICEKLWVKNLRVSFSANNLFIIYDHMKELGFDPETTDFWYYPQQRTYNFGVNVTF